MERGGGEEGKEMKREPNGESPLNKLSRLLMEVPSGRSKKKVKEKKKKEKKKSSV